MNISGKDLSGKSDQELYALSQKLSPAELKKLEDKLIFFRFILVIMLIAGGKANSDLKKISADMKQLSDWTNAIQQGITAAQAAKAKKPEGKFIPPPGFRQAITAMKLWADKNGIKIDIDLGTSTDGKFHFGTLHEDNLDTLIGQLQNISATLNTEVKTNSTKIQQVQSDVNNFTEAGSALIKKIGDIVATLQRGYA